ncbi:MAG: hypothetical protein FJX47_16515 [Alphaproteobacteria bacterium]|nr:hypothetical protein [Alphaproteobacteria bacterium]
MAPQHIFALIAAVAVANGIFSNHVAGMQVISPLWYPNWMPDDIRMLNTFAAVLVSTFTLMFAGVPATLIVRSLPAQDTKNVELWLWLFFTVLLSLSGLQRMLAILVGAG